MTTMTATMLAMGCDGVGEGVDRLAVILDRLVEIAFLELEGIFPIGLPSRIFVHPGRKGFFRLPLPA
jgi:hypothetical protein